MRRQNQSQRSDLGEGWSMARDIEAGRYGEEVKSLQRVAYWFTAVWVLAAAVSFGVLIWADEVNRLRAR